MALPSIKTIKTYVLRQGRMTEGQKKAFSHWPSFGIDVKNESLDWQEVFGNAHPVIVEIGFGMGDSLLTQALANPMINFVGIEVHAPGVGRLLNKAYESQLSNLKIIHHDALEVFNQMIADASLKGIQIFFPDPWPKKRHHKRRLIQPAWIDLLVTKLAANGSLHLATDVEDYAKQMLEVLSAHTRLKNTAADFSVRGERPLTKFETRGTQLGHGVWDLCFIKASP